MSVATIGPDLELTAHHTSRFGDHRSRLIVGHDLLAAAVAFPAAMLLRLIDDPVRMKAALPTLLYGTPLFIVCCVVAFGLFRVHRAFWRYSTSQELLLIIGAGACAVLMFLPALFLVDRLVTVPRAVPAIQWLVLVGLLCGSRMAYATMIVPSRARARHPGGVSHAEWEPIVVAGLGDPTALLIELTSRRLGRSRFEVVELLDDRPGSIGRSVHHVPVTGRLADLPETVARLSVHGARPRRVVLGLPPERYDAASLEGLYASAEQLGISVHAADEFVRLVLAECTRGSWTSVPRTKTVKRQQVSSTLKRLTDVLGALLLLLATAPVMLVLVLSVLGSLGRPVFFYQVRPGRNLQPFTLYKVRTLKHGHMPDGCVLSDEERRTFLGDLVRRTRLDELPQLWNVLVGDMSLIGPRPLLPRDLPSLGEETMHERFSARPGLTGWAQVNGGHQLTTDEKLTLDLYYIRNHSTWLDLRILGKTAWMVAFGESVDGTALSHAPGRHHPPIAGLAGMTVVRRETGKE